MAAYPNPLSTGRTFRVPFTRTLDFSTKSVRGTDGTEQRWALTAGREKWALVYRDLTLSERDQILSAFETSKGSFDQTMTFTWGGVTYPNVYFDADSISVTQAKNTLSDISLTLAQVRRAADTGTLGMFPSLASGARMQLPYTHQRVFDNVTVQTDGGRFVWYNRPGSYRVWSVGGPALKDADAQSLWDFFRRARGRLTGFSFTDPDSGVAYTNCRFGSDSLAWMYSGINSNAITTTVEQVG